MLLSKGMFCSKNMSELSALSITSSHLPVSTFWSAFSHLLFTLVAFPQLKVLQLGRERWLVLDWCWTDKLVVRLARCSVGDCYDGWTAEKDEEEVDVWNFVRWIRW